MRKLPYWFRAFQIYASIIRLTLSSFCYRKQVAYGVALYAGDLASLNPRQWVSDAIVDAMAGWVQWCTISCTEPLVAEVAFSLSYTEAEKKWKIFPRWHFQINFLKWKCVNFRLIFHWSLVPKVQLTSIVLDNGLSPGRRGAIIWTNDGLGWWCIYVSLGLNELMILLSTDISCASLITGDTYSVAIISDL